MQRLPASLARPSRGEGSDTNTLDIVQATGYVLGGLLERHHIEDALNKPRQLPDLRFPVLWGSDTNAHAILDQRVRCRLLLFGCIRVDDGSDAHANLFSSGSRLSGGSSSSGSGAFPSATGVPP